MQCLLIVNLCFELETQLKIWKAINYYTVIHYYKMALTEVKYKKLNVA